MKTSHTATIIFLIVCFSSIQSLSIQKGPCKKRDGTRPNGMPGGDASILPLPFGNAKGPYPLPPNPQYGKGLITPSEPTPALAPATPPTPKLIANALPRLSCPATEQGFTSGVAYVRFRAPKKNSMHLQISQAVVFDRNGVNVALKKPASLSKPDPGSTGPGNQVVQAAWAVDGIIQPKCGWPNDKIMITETWPADQDPWWMVDLQGEFDVKQVWYYNRNCCCEDRASGVIIELLNSEKQVIKSYQIGQWQIIMCIATN